MLANKIMGATSAAPDINYIEDVFSTYLYTGNGSTQTITNGIDLAGKDGLVWLKSRSYPSSNTLFDTNRGVYNCIFTDQSTLQNTINDTLTAFNANGFTLGSDALDGKVNTSPRTYASWTFRKQPKFFDVVTYTGTGVSGNTIAHSLGSVPGCIIYKQTSAAGESWGVYHRSLPTDYILNLNGTSGQILRTERVTAVSSTNVTIGNNSQINASGATYVMYFFAHDAGGFGLSGNENVVSCGSFTTDGSGNATVNLGYEPQWALWKTASGTYPVDGWHLSDNMRGWSQTTNQDLTANTSSAESAQGASWIVPNATGFSTNNTGALAPTTTYIYIAIRRGPMKVPTDGTKVFSPFATSSASNPLTVTTNFPVDMSINRFTGAGDSYLFDRLRGANASASGGTSTYLKTNATNAEATAGTAGDNMQSNTALIDRSFISGTSDPKIYWNFRRAPSFFDEVCYTGTGVSRTITHNLAAVPELWITKCRSAAGGWAVGANGALGPVVQTYGFLNDPRPVETVSSAWLTPTTTTIGIGSTYPNDGLWNRSGDNYVAYLFATCAGVSKVGSYTGTGTTQAINCGFAAGARFVMIKRTDSTGNWYVWDSARGIVAGNDPYLLLNSTAAEVTGTDYIDPVSSGFEISSTAPAEINASGGSYIFLAVA